MIAKCATCVWYQGALVGQCRALSPNGAGWPTVRADDWCGKHKPIASSQPALRTVRVNDEERYDH